MRIVVLNHLSLDGVQRLQSELLEGKRRSRCWLGCIHRTDKELSRSVRSVLSLRSKASK